jgi:hypothetical protein
MDDRIMSQDRKEGSPELWLTPLIGICLLAPMIWHWRIPLTEYGWAIFGNHRWAHFKEPVGLAAVAGVVPLFVTACLQRVLRAWKWHLVVQVIAALAVGYLAVYYFYYYALYPFPHWALAQDEGQADGLAIYESDIWALGVLGAVAALLSKVVTHWLTRRAGLPEIPSFPVHGEGGAPKA